VSRGDGGVSIADRLTLHRSTNPLDHPHSLIAASQALDDHRFDTPDGPNRWLDAVDRATAAHRSLEHQRSRELDHDLGISL